ncbi:MAG: PLP-dependent aminotransferase family protein [Bacteroidales bacterium]|nr:PLP-dependent aminotransferase family protein [Bacteroidales bacterium]MBQ7772426.1 PLP-dependent aminotransferase family protein [Bacteroidales bacterium]MBQ8812532.1 PLP-dependent aminotransferase family protein [Bacteroidales bacterium]
MQDYRDIFSEDVGSFFRSPVREIFKKVDLNAIYSFAGGYPSAETFPMEEIRTTMSEVIDKYGAKAFQYGATQGVVELRQEISKRYGVPVERVQITSSSQQGIDVCTRVMVDPGDVILTSSPSYLGALQSFCSYRADIRGVVHDDDLPAFRKAYEETIAKVKQEGKKIKFLYMIPDFQNPSGESLRLDEREMLVQLAQDHGFLIVEDSPYRELRYDGEHIPTMYSLAPDHVIHLGSFSKIFAPGFRLGWAIAHPDILDKIYVCKQSLDLCPPIFDQYVAAEFLQSGRLDDNLEKSIGLYKGKRDHLLSLLEDYMPEGVKWTRPEGGLFLFLTMPKGFDAVKFYDKALDAGVAYVAGEFFHPDRSGKNTMRLNFSFMNKERMTEGIRILAKLLKDEIL